MLARVRLLVLLLPVCSCTTLIPDACPVRDGQLTIEAGLRMVVLQQGQDGYAGTEDATVQRWNSGQNVGSHENLQIHKNASSPTLWHSRVFIRFELSGVSRPGEILRQATLQLHEYLHNAFTDSAETMAVHELKVRPVEGEVTDLHFAAGRSWAAPLGLAGADFEMPAVASYSKDLVLAPGGKWIDLQVTGSVRKWLAEPSRNGGWLIRGSSDDSGEPASNDLHYHSAQHVTPSLRPRLELTFEGAGG